MGALDSPEDTDTTDDDVDVDKHKSDREPEEAPTHYSEVTGEGIDLEEDPEANDEAHTHTREGVQESGNISNADEVEVSASVECSGEGEDISSSSSRQGRARTRAVHCRGGKDGRIRSTCGQAGTSGVYSMRGLRLGESRPGEWRPGKLWSRYTSC